MIPIVADIDMNQQFLPIYVEEKAIDNPYCEVISLFKATDLQLQEAASQTQLDGLIKTYQIQKTRQIIEKTLSKGYATLSFLSSQTGVQETELLTIVKDMHTVRKSLLHTKDGREVYAEHTSHPILTDALPLLRQITTWTFS